MSLLKCLFKSAEAIENQHDCILVNTQIRHSYTKEKAVTK
jgi:hypothetical protein